MPAALDSPRLGVIIALSLMLLGGLLRGWAATWGFSSDEVCWIFDGGVYGNWVHGETAVNPPAIRLVLTAISTDHWQIAHMGRAWSFAVGTGAIGLMFWLGRLVGRNRNLVGILAAAYLALLPLAIVQAGQFRSYATLLFVLLWHLIALVRVVDAEGAPERSWVVHLVVSAALIPQVHYAGVAVLFLEGLAFAIWLRDGRFVRYYLPAAVLFAPLGYRIVTGTSEHLAPDADRLNNLIDLFRVALHHPILSILVVLCWFRFQRRQRIVLLGAVSSAVGLLAVASYHHARPDLGIIPWAYQIPLMATLPLVISTEAASRKRIRGGAWIVLLGAFVMGLWEQELPALALEPRVEDGPRWMARDLRAGSWQADRPTYVDPAHFIQPLYFHLEHRRLLTPCPVAEGPSCFEFREEFFMGFNHGDIPPSYVVLFGAESRPQRLADQCTLARSQPTYSVWDCPNGWKAP